MTTINTRYYALPALLLLAVAWPLCPAIAQDWSQGFEDGQAGAEPYHREAPMSALETRTDDAAAGARYLRVELPGQRKLEGFSVTATGLQGARLAKVTARVRGKGDIWLCLNSRNGWLYSPQTTPLTDQWQAISLTKVLVAKDTSLGIFFISRDIQQDAVFEVDDIRLDLGVPLETYDEAVGPWLLQAEEYATRAGYLVDDASALGGKAVAHSQYMFAEGFPFPRTNRATFVYLRVRPSMQRDSYRLYTRHGGNKQTLGSTSPQTTGSWQWVRFPGVVWGEVGPTFGIECRIPKGSGEAAAFDAIVLSTEAELDAAALDGAPALLPAGSHTVVARCAQPPQIDGQPDDACWADANTCLNFLKVRSEIRAEADTAAKLCYDDANLYIQYVCEEPILSVAGQRTHEFRANVTQRDAALYADDCCILLLRPDLAANSVFDFTVNALGTLADASCDAGDLWGSRDTSWNSTATTMGRTEDGRWSVEMAIPFADLGVTTPEPGDTWHAVVGRLAATRKENSTWNLSKQGFHDPDEFGTLVFGAPCGGVGLDAPASLQVGGNEVALTVTGTSARPLLVATTMATASGAHHRYGLLESQTGPARVPVTFDIAQEGKFAIRHSVLDAASLRPLYATPTTSRPVRSSIAVVSLTCTGPYELYLDAERISRGQQAKDAQIQAPLHKGANVFALKLEQGTAAARVVPPSRTEGDTVWKINAGDTVDATLAALDDSKWAIAQPTGGSTPMAPVVGTPGKPAVLRHTLLWEHTRQWPTPDPALYVARNTNQHLSFICEGLKGRDLLDWSLYVAVPHPFELLDSTGYYPHVEWHPRFVCEKLGEQEIQGRTMAVAKVSATKPLRPRSTHPVFSVCNVMVRYREEAGEPQKDDTSFVFWTQANDGSVAEPYQTIPVHILPPVRGQQPSKLIWQLWGSYLGAMENENFATLTLQTAQASGFTNIVAGSAWASDNAPKYGMTHTRGMNFQAWSLNMQPYLEEHPDDRLVKTDGTPSDSEVCTSRLLGPAWVAVRERLQEQVDNHHAHTYDYDYEYSPFTGPHSCYCPACLAAFRARAELPNDLELTPQTIKEQYREQWIDFMTWQVAQLFRKFKDTIHELSPGAKFSVYSGYQIPEGIARYGVDWKYVGQLEACDAVGCGYGRPVPGIHDTIEALNGIPAVFGALIHPYSTAELTPQAPFRKARTLRRALDATGGVLIYDRQPMDGRSWYAIGETTRLVAEFEDLFLTGKRTAVEGQDDAVVQALSDGAVTLVCVMNGSSKPTSHSFALPAQAGAGTEYYSGETVSAGQSVEFELPPGETKVYVLRR